jgi:hypothetical protein
MGFDAVGAVVQLRCSNSDEFNKGRGKPGAVHLSVQVHQGFDGVRRQDKGM